MTTDDPRFPALVDLVGRCGARSFAIEYHASDEIDDAPTVWFALAKFDGGAWQIGADLDPLLAVFNLADRLIDGAECKHCGQPTAVDHDPASPLRVLFAGDAAGICWYRFDPELATYRRSCEGVAI